MLPGGCKFPTEFNAVAIVTCLKFRTTSLFLPKRRKDDFEIASKTDYYNGNAAIATESLAEALAHENYFNEVVICDWPYVPTMSLLGEGALSQEEQTGWCMTWT